MDISKQKRHNFDFSQDFKDDYRYTIAGPEIVRNSLDLTPLTKDFTAGDISDIFERVFLDQSNLSVYEVINLIFIFRSLYTVK